MKKRLIPTILILILILALGAALAVWILRPSGLRLAGWRILSGGLEAAATPADGGAADGTHFLARQETLMQNAGIRARLAPGSLVRLAAGGSPAEAPRLPDIIQGSMTVTAARPFGIGGDPAVPRESVELSVGPTGAKVLRGTVEIRGGLLTRGALIHLGPRGDGADDPGPVPEAETEDPEDAMADLPPAARIIDGRNGRLLAGVEVMATFSRGEDGYPSAPEPGSQVLARTGEDGLVHLDPFQGEDPRLKLHLQASLPGFLPEVIVVEGDRDLDGCWPLVTIALRQSLTCRVLFLDPDGAPLAGAAVEEEAADVLPDPFAAEDSLEEGRVLRASSRRIRYTDAEGVLLARQGLIRIALRHPFLHLLSAAPGDGASSPAPMPTSSLLLDLRPPADRRPLPDPGAVVRTGFLEPREYRILDRDRFPVPDSLVEIRMDGLPLVRLHTGPAGQFSYTPRPFAPGESELPLLPENPRRGTLLILSPLLWRQEIPVAFPSREGLIIAGGRLGGRLAIQVLERDGGNENGDGDGFRTVPAEGIHLGGDMTLVRRTAAGEAVWEGPLPAGGSDIELFLRGHLPALIRVPPHVAGAAAIDLGEVILDPGWTFPLRLLGADPQVCDGLRFHLSDRERPDLAHEFRPDREGSALVGGIVPGRRYSWAVGGSRVLPVEGEIFAAQELLETGLSIDLELSPVAEVLVAGQVEGLQPEGWTSVRVVERYWLGDPDDPHPCASYPLAPDGILGSRRIIPPLRRAEVFLSGPGDLAGFAARDFPPGSGRVDFGRISLSQFPRGAFTFRARGVGIVPPPEDVSLVAEEDRNQDLARVERSGPILQDPQDLMLRIAHLRPGNYQLRWGAEGSKGEAHRFTVRPSDIEVGGEVLREPREKETVALRIVDPEGKPLDEVRIGGNRPDFPPPICLSGGTCLVEVLTREECRISLAREGFLPATLVLPAGAPVPDPLVMRRGARARARIHDIDGRLFDGDLTITFTSEEAPPIPASGPPEAILIHGGPLVVPVVQGQMDDPRFPPGLQRIALRASSSEALVERIVEIAPKGINDLGTISLAETRSISGTVVLPAGEPAPEAVVSLLKPGTHPRFPFKKPDPRDLLYSAKTSPLGRFRIDGIPLGMPEGLVLAAHLAGWTDAVEVPVDLEAKDHVLVLSETTRLCIDAGYADSAGFDEYEFRLQYAGTGKDARDVVDLGPVPPGPRGGRVFEGISPGIYRLLWGLRESHPALPARKAEAVAAPGVPASLAVWVPERTIEGQAILNGEPVALGWVVLVSDPARPGEILAGRVREGRFTIPVPARPGMGPALGALLPERDPLPAMDFGRGEGLPVEIPDFHGALRRKFLQVRVQAHDFILQIPPEYLRENPGAEIEFPHYEGSPGGFRRVLRKERLDGPLFRLDLLPAGRFSFRVIGRSGTRLFPDIEMDQDIRIVLGA